MACSRCWREPPDTECPDPFCVHGIAAREATTKPSSPGDGGGLRFSAGKPRYDLMPPEAVIALANHYLVGSRIYAERNWERGMAWGQCFRAVCSHAFKWLMGHDYDAETGTHHMIAVAWNAFALFTYHIRKIGTDDRPKTAALGGVLWQEPELVTAKQMPDTDARNETTLSIPVPPVTSGCVRYTVRDRDSAIGWFDVVQDGDIVAQDSSGSRMPWLVGTNWLNVFNTCARNGWSVEK